MQSSLTSNNSEVEKVLLFFEEKNCIPGKVFIGRDTRSSSDRLALIAHLGLLTVKTSIIHLGKVSTPMVNYNIDVALKNKSFQNFNDFYYNSYMNSYQSMITLLNSFKKDLSNKPKTLKRLNQPLVKNLAYKFDGCCGIGYIVMQNFLQRGLNKIIPVDIYNGPSDGLVNSSSGTEYILSKKQVPLKMPSECPFEGFSCDGDGDRIVFFFNTMSDPTMKVINGDGIMALLALGMQHLRAEFSSLESLKLGAVSTLYTDGNLIEYLGTIGVDFYIAPTGLKFMVRVANKLDIAILTEPNGHASIRFSENAREKLKKAEGNVGKFFNDFFEIHTQSGDFMGIFLVANLFMRLTKLSLPKVAELFNEKVKRTIKLPVKCKSAVKMDEMTGKHSNPIDLQGFLDNLMAKYQKEALRVFVRASGTEDIIRVHFETNCTKVIEQVEPILKQFLMEHSEINKIFSC